MARKTVAIVGSHARTSKHAPFDRKYVDMWVFNEAGSLGVVRRVNAAFQMHAPAVWKNPLNMNDAGHYAWLQKPQAYPIYMLEKYEVVPAAELYPLEEICTELLGTLLRGRRARKKIRFFLSSVDYAIAMAIYLGYESIEIYGIEMDSGTEYQYQKPGAYFWMGVCVGRRVELIVHEESHLFEAPLYGYEGRLTLEEKDLEARAEELRGFVEEAKRAVEAANEGVEKALEKARTLTPAPLPKRERGRTLTPAGPLTPDPPSHLGTGLPGGERGGGNGVVKEYFASLKVQAEAVIDFGSLTGAIEENERYMLKGRRMEEAAGEQVFARQEFERTGAKAKELADKRQAQMNNIGGQATLYWNALQKGLAADKEEADKRIKNEELIRAAEMYAEVHQKFLEAAFEFGRMQGIYLENVQLLEKLDELVRAAGGSKAVAKLTDGDGRWSPAGVEPGSASGQGPGSAIPATTEVGSGKVAVGSKKNGQ